MATTREVTAAKDERLRRGRRHYTPDLLGRPCRDSTCHLMLPKVLEDAGELAHPMCTPDAKRMLRSYRAAVARLADEDAHEANVSPPDDTGTSPRGDI